MFIPTVLVQLLFSEVCSRDLMNYSECNQVWRNQFPFQCSNCDIIPLIFCGRFNTQGENNLVRFWFLLWICKNFKTEIAKEKTEWRMVVNIPRLCGVIDRLWNLKEKKIRGFASKIYCYYRIISIILPILLARLYQGPSAVYYSSHFSNTIKATNE